MPPESEAAIGAVIAAAGQSKRMGRPKQLLPWGERTVIETVVANLDAAGARPIVCVVGHLQEDMEAALKEAPAAIVYNEAYRSAEMLSSYQAGVSWLAGENSLAGLGGVLLALGDQPHISADIIRQVIKAAKATPDNIVIPSHNRRRGHPVYLPRWLWPELLALSEEESLRILLKKRVNAIVYVNLKTDVILHDMDTAAAYERLRLEARKKTHSSL